MKTKFLYLVILELILITNALLFFSFFLLTFYFQCRESTNPANTNEDDPSIVPRSKSSDILKKDTPCNDMKSSLPRQSHFNTLKQWGRNRLRQIARVGSINSGSDENKQSHSSDKQVSDIDDFNTSDTLRMNNAFRKRQLEKEKEKKLLHERKPSYSSSEKSITTVSQSTTSTLPICINPVKLRESSILRRQRRHGLGHKDEINSSSGNWSASSESGRTSIGSEITTTTHPKSSTSSGSLSHHHPGSSGPPSSIISRRRFLNTSASSSVTSDGTATPDLQMCDFHDEGETSSVYSCDTEGYYTSFHVDSGLKTLKEEEPPTPLHTSTALSSTTSFGSSGNNTIISPENEYELFGRGSTSTTTSSAGTICTVVIPGESDRNSTNTPAVPERKSSLTKLNRSSSSVSSSTLERSHSSSTVGSTLERMATIKRNGVLLQKEVAALVHQAKEELKVTRTESPDSGNNTSSSPIESNSNSSPTQSQQGVRSNSEFEYSESSDLECVDRIERIRVKTTINTSRIPSMCVITPGNSDDECVKNRKNSDSSDDNNKELPKVIEIAFGDETPLNESEIRIMQNNGATKTPEYDVPIPRSELLKKEHVKKTTLLPLNSFMDKLRGVIPSLNKKSPNKEAPLATVEDDLDLYDTGEYVTIADVANNNKKQNHTSGVYYSNDVVKRNLATVLSGNLNEETEYVSLNELPCNMRCESNLLANDGDAVGTVTETIDNTTREITECNSKEEEGIQSRIRGARVTLDAHGKVVYSSDSLKRRKGAHTTFVPGPNVKDTTQKQESVATEPSNVKDTVTVSSPLLSGGVLNRKITQVRPVVSQKTHTPIQDNLTNTIVSPTSENMRGAYVNLQELQSAVNPLMTQSQYAPPNEQGKHSNSKKYTLKPVSIKSGNGFSLKLKPLLPPSPLTLYNNHNISLSQVKTLVQSERENESVDPNNSVTTITTTCTNISTNTITNNTQLVKRSNSYRLANDSPPTPILIKDNSVFKFATINASKKKSPQNLSFLNNSLTDEFSNSANSMTRALYTNNEKINSSNVLGENTISPLIFDSPNHNNISQHALQQYKQKTIWSPKNKLYQEMSDCSNIASNSNKVSPVNYKTCQSFNENIGKNKSKIYDKRQQRLQKQKHKISIHSISNPIQDSLIKRSKTDEGFASLDDEDENEDEKSSKLLDVSLEKLLDELTSGISARANSTEVLETSFDCDLSKLEISSEKPLTEKISFTDKLSRKTDLSRNEFLDSDDENDEQDIEFYGHGTKTPFYNPNNLNKKSVIYMTPSKLTIPVDSSQHRARVLSFSTNNSNNSTDIW